ncbi:CocE/NonD family hydrolase [Kiloniella sp. b19]|uniref:CocE/NonD family hydrolase n=1 Tax=Kiloniella sp. GXU_MW_B19 TaxID=3141326 RepID=UPI0031CDC2E6
MMTAVGDPREAIEINRDLAIPLPDGTRLSAKVWRPKDQQGPLPAIVEYLPYRKSDMTAPRDATMHPYFAANGYVCLRIDRRGCGDSEGLFDDEYSPQELQDGVDALNWIATQDWCDGNIGIQGISWGGFNGLQLAALQPEPLKAIITIGSTVDRYADDIHFKGGIQVGENIGWAATLMSISSMPPDPTLVGDRWRDTWLERLEAMPFLAQEWMSHPDRDDYWKHGSVCEDYSRITIPVLAMGGMHDGYRNTMAHLAENLQSPVKAVAGPWGHKYPHISMIEPSVNYLDEALRWWDCWLKGVDNGVPEEPLYRAYMMDSVKPSMSLDYRSGQWIGENSWPPETVSSRLLSFGDDGVLGGASPFVKAVPADLAVGRNCGEYFPFGFGPGELPDDQIEDDRLSACFDSEAFGEDLEILGAPKVRLGIASDQPAAQVIVRLCDLRPDGTSGFISFGLLNLQHRDGFEAKVPLEAGREYDVEITLDQTAFRLPAGHRLRVAVSSSYWPYCWPEGQLVHLTLRSGELELPVRSCQDFSSVSFDAPKKIPMTEHRKIRDGKEHRNSCEKDGRIELELFGDHGSSEDPETGLISSSSMREFWRIHRDDPATAEVEILWERAQERAEWKVSSRILTRMKGYKEKFVFEHQIKAYEGEKLVFEKEMKGEKVR